MYASLMTGAIGIKGFGLEESIALAADTGFAGVWYDIREAKRLADEQGVDHVRELFASRGVRPGGWGAPVRWQDDAQRDEDLAALPALAELGVALGNPFTTTGIMPGHDERTYNEQYGWILERLRPFAEALKASGVRLGIEFIAPKTLRNRFKHEFIYCMPDMLKLGRDVGTGNVGVLFDVWHHYTAHGTVFDLDNVSVEDIVVVHVNDAPEGIEIDEQQDLSRTLPMETGVIDAPAMLRRLDAMGFDGPVIAEPFSARINAIAADDPVAAATETATSIRKLFDAAGVQRA
ncbi:MAG TPA: sugar phosphate isomerase/epimerase family protein [Thermomicrobiales bacterium]|nr:sugar phosphate isomerase/epimerase family protein [Thermomicrobiales bacterium]